MGDNIFNLSRKQQKVNYGTAFNDSNNPFYTPTQSHRRLNSNNPQPSQPGDSGGPVWNDDGFIGFITGRYSDNTLNFKKMPSDYALNSIPKGERYSPFKSPVIAGIKSFLPHNNNIHPLSPIGSSTPLLSSR